MKFFHKLTIILALAGIGGLTACSDDDSGFLKRNLREMSFSYVESSNTFTIRATGDWYISDVPDSREWTGAYSWVHVDRLSGKGSPDTYQKITVTCDQNVSDERTATIYLHGCGEENVAIAIKQENGIFEWKPFDNGQRFGVLGLLKLNAESEASLRIPYIKAVGTEKYTVSVTQTGGNGLTAAAG
ncbi:BACON domain-containing protein, partial [Alistipes finegoldii]|uniref:BACON domain-containing protein n=2 Tax=Alistipes TaxID=239759 RepID=UPI0024957909